ncbi:SAM-dependent methyltransferase [Actinacidiphila sp. ITFR-21]|uniref:SAM-dependent methyltransferase n=1 Tax=Actinacidiphila sp. ITFR-21 TaxID=3075199 RepID=UPI00288B508E|nr:SAM-dependent methyltransferase [Streptomyces sp. ITFR-21]WNI18291.1 SAM-dependent methyltransferase [Streptomyces sp. ITFR-21]
MAPTLYRGTRPGAQARARDWAEIQERMLVPLYETVYDRLGIGPYTRLLGLGCGTGLALLLAAGRGAVVTGCDPDATKLAVARDRLLPDPAWSVRDTGRGPVTRTTRLLLGGPQDHLSGFPDTPGAADSADGGFDVVTAFDPAMPAADLEPALAAVAATASPGCAVVLAGWGPPERCATSRVLRAAVRPAETRGSRLHDIRLSGRDDLEDLARGAGLRPDGSGRVSCPFGYPDLPSAVRGLLSTGLFDAAVDAADRHRVGKELAAALRPYRRPDGTVRMDNVFRYLIARM